MTNIQNLTAPTMGNPLRVELGNNTTATITRVRAADDNKDESAFSISIDRNGERIFEANQRGVLAWQAIMVDLYTFSE